MWRSTCGLCDGTSRHESTRWYRSKFGDRCPVSSNRDRLAPLDISQNGGGIVSKLSLSDSATHGTTVADVAQCSDTLTAFILGQYVQYFAFYSNFDLASGHGEAALYECCLTDDVKLPDNGILPQFGRLGIPRNAVGVEPHCSVWESVSDAWRSNTAREQSRRSSPILP